MRTEYEFLLPLGYVDAYGHVHRRGVMRLATALDEIEPLGDPRVKNNEAFFGLLVLSRVVRSLGTLTPVPMDVIARLYAADFAYLQAFYTRINGQPPASVPMDNAFPTAVALPDVPAGVIESACPQCGAELLLDLAETADPLSGMPG
ncbi:hypothetical protein [Deinococcus peraridilitoris]|uniref:Phage tail assembly protein n=1 Tax=Deinococcus peraridilitoris (strain DSM 19664 / LMG 22246 / CIP 109416 / KR-200) TaxID=937777 RepID=L0A2H2_DEIPD|nr:hypothetical protein [Deinococcus peraridilitoris]AFZ67624.1 hypothetical protein Deipe_2134 [Deinococcus peraridilitoris DSM 19664]